MLSDHDRKEKRPHLCSLKTFTKMFCLLLAVLMLIGCQVGNSSQPSDTPSNIGGGCAVSNSEPEHFSNCYMRNGVRICEVVESL